MQNLWPAAAAQWHAHGGLLAPLLLSLWMAGTDLATRRIPNYLTFGAAAAGLGWQCGFHGLPGLWDSLGGLALGFFLLLLPYLKGGMGAGDVKALAALGAWLGWRRTLYLFIYMGLSGLLVIVAVLWWRGELGDSMRRGWVLMVNWVLSRPGGGATLKLPAPEHQGIPYGAALALGMAFLCWRPG